MDLLLAVGVWAAGAWLAYRCTRWATERDHDTKKDRATARRGWTSGGDAVH
jgi:hypothetical protein